MKQQKNGQINLFYAPPKKYTELVNLSFQQVSELVGACSKELKLANYGYGHRKHFISGNQY